MEPKHNILLPETPILIVDDNKQYAYILRKMLESTFSYSDITWIENCAEAYQQLKSKTVDPMILFVDFRFPVGETGGELLTQLFAEGFLTDKVSFLITSEPTVENTRQATQAGAYGVVAKPFDREELRKQIQRAQRERESHAVASF